MKKLPPIYSLFLLVTILMPLFVQSQIVNIPDAVFKSRLVNHTPTIDTNADGEIQVSEAEAVLDGLNVNGTSGTTGITNLTGLEAFVNIDQFEASNNNIISVDFTNNTLLEDITMNATTLTNINVSNNPVLRALSLSDSDLTLLDVSNNPALTLLQANFSNLTSLDTSNNPALMFLYIQVNQIASLDISNNPNMVRLTASSNPLTSIQVANSPILLSLLLRDCNLTTLDVSNTRDLRQLIVKNNPNLTYINLKNGTNENIVIDGGTNSSNFEDVPLLDEVCIDNITSALASFIETQAAHAVNFSETCILGIEETEKLNVSIFPNPAKSIVNIDAINAIVHIEMYDILGRLVLTNSSNTGISSFNINSLHSGLYTARVKDLNNQTAIVKIIKE